MKPLTPHMKHTLADLLEASNGEIGTFYPAIGVHYATLKGLFHRGLTEIETRQHNGKVQWFAALTKAGFDLAELLGINDTGINAKRQRTTIQLQLDQNRADHTVAIERITGLKGQGEFTQTILQLLELHEQLKQGDIRLFRKLYPQAVEAMRIMVQGEQDTNTLLEEFKHHVTKTLANIQLQQPEPTVKPLQPVNGIGQPRTLNVSKLDTPTFDDDEDLLTVTADKDAGKRASQNFINSLMALQN